MKYFIYGIFTFVLISCSKDDNTSPTSYTIWNGPHIEFIKNSGSDPDLEENQDRITTSVAITRGLSGGEIYNIILETESVKGISPLGTEWAIGEISDIANLSFSPFRDAVGSPKQVVGKSLVLHILEEDIYLSVEFTSWGEGNTNNGSFSYNRATEN